MCGIAGYFTVYPERVRAVTLQTMSRMLLLGIESRGRDATGYAYVSSRDKRVWLAKAPIKASDFLQVDGHILSKKGIKRMPRSMLLHTRAATQGLPSDNQNNHPIYSKASGLCLIHNGWISNDDLLVKKHDLHKDAEVDTEAYLRLIEKHYLEHIDEPVETSIKKATADVFGSLACAMIQGGRTESMWLWKEEGALWLAETDWGWVFASTKSDLLNAMLYSCSAFDLGRLRCFEPAKGSLFTFNSTGKITKSDIATPSWDAMPKELEDRVTRTWVNGVASVRRKRKTTTYFSESMEDYFDEWGYPCGRTGLYGRINNTNPSHSQHSQRYLPSFSRGGEAETRRSTARDTEKYGNGNPPQGLRASVCQYLNDISLSHGGRSKECYCRPDYVCLRCGAVKKYFDIDVDRIIEAQNAENLSSLWGEAD